MCMIPKLMSSSQTTPLKFWIPLFDFFLDISNSYNKQKTLYFFLPKFVSIHPNQTHFPQYQQKAKPTFNYLNQELRNHPWLYSFLQAFISKSKVSLVYSTVGLTSHNHLLSGLQLMCPKTALIPYLSSLIHSSLIYQRDILKI